MPDDDYDYQERAAILEFDAGLSRHEAEAAAQYWIGQVNAHPPVQPHDSDGTESKRTPEPSQSASSAPPDRAAARNQAERDCPGAEYRRRESPVGEGRNGAVPYAVAAARASPGYMAAKAELSKILTGNKLLKGATP